MKDFQQSSATLKYAIWKNIKILGVQRISDVSSFSYPIPFLQNWKFLSTKDFAELLDMKRAFKIITIYSINT